MDKEKALIMHLDEVLDYQNLENIKEIEMFLRKQDFFLSEEGMLFLEFLKEKAEGKHKDKNTFADYKSMLK